MINPSSMAFDIDGVLADIMTLFIDIARDDYDIGNIKSEDMTCYSLEDCLDMDPSIIEEILNRIQVGNYSAILKPIEGASEVLTRLGRKCGPILFVTARSYSDPIREWIIKTLPLDPVSVEVVATGTFEGKTEVLLERGVTHFVEDRLETCFFLDEAGITPVLFRQPWNRKNHPFIEVGSWSELKTIIRFDGIKF